MTNVGKTEAIQYTFTNIADSTGPFSADFFSFGAPVINDNGIVAWRADLDSGAQGIFLGGRGRPTITLADTFEGSALRFAAFQGISINNSGHVAFFARTDFDLPALYVGNGESLIRVANDLNVTSTATPSISDTGMVAFDEIGFAYTALSGVLTPVNANENAPVKTYPVESAFLNDAGTLAYHEPGSAGGIKTLSISSGVVATIADASDGFISFGLGKPTINNLGTTAFRAFNSIDNLWGVFTSDGGSPVTIIGDGTVRIDTGHSPPTINDSGVVASKGLFGSGQNGIFTGRDAVADKVIATNDQLFGSTVKRIEGFSREGLNSGNELAFGYQLANGVFGIAVATPYLELSTPSTPMPTDTPPIAAFPTPEQLHRKLSLFVDSNVNQFSLPTQVSLTTPIALIGPLVQPSSGTFLKDFASDLGERLERFGKAMDIVLLSQYLFEPDIAAAERDIILMFAPESANVSVRTYQLNQAVVDVFSPKPLGPLYGALSLINLGWGDLLPEQLKIYGSDPPNSDYLTVVSPRSIPPFPSSITGDFVLDDAIQKAYVSALSAAIYLEAVNLSFDRYAAAYADGSAIGAGLQLDAMLNYLALYNSTAIEAADNLESLALLLRTTQALDLTFDENAYLQFHEELSLNGFSAEVISHLTTLGFSSSEIDATLANLLNFDFRSITSDYDELLFSTAATIRQGTTSAVSALEIPEPATSVLIALCFGMAVGRRRSRRIAT